MDSAGEFVLAQGGGAIVNTASVAGLISPPGMAAYCVSKHAVVALSESLHHDLRERGSRVGVSVLCPAYVPTAIAEPRFSPVTEKSRERLAKASGQAETDQTLLDQEGDSEEM